MRKKTIFLMTVLIVLAAVLSPVGLQSTRAETIPGADSAAGLTASAADLAVSETGLYIVQLKDASLASYMGGVPGLAATSPQATGERRLDAGSAASQAYLSYLSGKQDSFIAQMNSTLGRPVEVVFQYLGALNAMAVRVSHDEALALMSVDGVRTVYPDTLREMDTDVGPIHIGAPAIWDGDTLTGVASRGEGVVIGVIDSGINSQHPSFAATDGDGYTHTNPYGAGVYHGWCATNPGFCNDKLIGAYGFNPVAGDPEDLDGHGSHTASTSGGNAHDASFTVGTDPYVIRIQGVAPRANIVAYKVCNPSCPGSASVAAVDSAIVNDEVDVLNYSISGSDDPWNDAVDLAFLDAFNAGIFVSASAGNAGPGASTVAKTGPWNASVGASTHNRIIANTLDITGPTTPAELQGLAAVPGEAVNITTNISADIRYDPANLDGCVAFSAGFFTGDIALIQRGNCTFATKQANAAAAGAIAVVVFNNVGGPPISMGATVATPEAVFIDLVSGTAVKDYIDANPTATAQINASTSLIYDDAWYDIMAGFSSRGPSQFELVKPDYVAPGVNILAAVASDGGDPVQYGFYQGTSMSSPHGAGAAALMVGLNPSWSPAAIKSAMASGAVPDVLLKEDGVTPADAYDQGSGLLNLAAASNVGLVFEETYDNYVAANPDIGGDPKTLNQPSMVNYECVDECTWVRTVTSVMTETMDYDVSFTSDVAINVTVTPASFSIAPGATQVLTITADVSALPVGVDAFASVVLTPQSMLVTPATSRGVADTSSASDDISAAAPGASVVSPLSDWEAPTVVLYDNGPLATCSGCGAGGADESMLQSVSLSMTTLGFGHQVLNNNWVADDFTVTDAGGWNLDYATFFAYQTNSTTTSTMTNVNWVVYDGDPSSGGSVVASGSGLFDTGWTNIYRTTETTIGVTNRPIMYDTVDMGGLYLPAGTYWLAWQTDGTLASGPWAPPVTINGQATTGNGLQYIGSTSTWGPANDGGSLTQQALPFTLEGTVAVSEYDFTSTPNAAIPDDGYDGTQGSMVCDIIDASSIPNGTLVTDVTVDLSADHTWIGDLVVKLWSPDGSVLGLLSRPGFVETVDDGTGCCGDSSELSSAAPVLFTDASANDAESMGSTIGDLQVVCTDDGTCDFFPNPGIVAGLSDFAGFAGENASGNWTLCMGDSAGGDLGTFVEWTLTVGTSGGGGGGGVATQQLPLVVIPDVSDPAIDVDPDALASTQPANTVVDETLTISNIGTGVLDWTIDEDNSPAASVVTTLPLEAIGPAIDGNSFAPAGSGEGQSATPSGAETPEGLTTITHSASQAIVAGSVSCNAGGLHTDNSYMRVFDLNAFGLTGGFDVTSVEFGIETAAGATGSQPVTVNLYVMTDPNAPLTFSNLTLIGTTSEMVPDQSLSLYSMDVTGSAGPGSKLVVEVFTPEGQTDGNSFFIGSNPNGQTGPTYLAAADCGVPEPTDTAAIGFPNMHMVMNVTGDTASSPLCDAPEDIPWLSVNPTSGSTDEGLSSDVTVTFDSTGLALGTYEAALCVNSNDAVKPVVPVMVTLDVVEGAEIDVTPASLDFTVPADSTSDGTLTIGNTGLGDLNWSIDEDSTPGAAPVAASWHEDFDTYATGQDLHGVGGWKGWDNTPGASASTSAAQAASAPNSVAILGGSDLVHEFNYTSGTVDLIAWQYIPSDFSGQSYFILLNTYSDGGPYNWSDQLMFDSGTGLVTNDGGVSGGSMPYITDQWVQIRFEIDLDANTQGVYYNNTLLFSGTWTEEISGGGAAAFGAIDLFANNASVIYYDDMHALVPEVSCDAPEDIPWLSVSPTSGTTSPSSSDDVTVSVDTTGLTNGETYEAALCINSNDADTPLVVVPVTLMVTDYNIYLPIIAREP
jgi:subtilisin-like proprotein convertase family protein